MPGGVYVRASVEVRGIVQGVGFRPFIHRLVERHGLSGWVRNTSEGAELEARGRGAGRSRPSCGSSAR